MNKLPEWGRISVSVLWSLTFLVALVFAYMRKDMTSIALLVGAVIAKSGTVVDYWMGSSSGSTAKSETIAAMKQPPPTA